MAALPSKQALLAKARAESSRKITDDVEGAIVVLRNEKHFSFREISLWLNRNGIRTSESVVIRVFGAWERKQKDASK